MARKNMPFATLASAITGGRRLAEQHLGLTDRKLGTDPPIALRERGKYQKR